MKIRTSDCVQNKRHRTKLARKQLEYWRKGTNELKKLQKQARDRGILLMKGEK